MNTDNINTNTISKKDNMLSKFKKNRDIVQNELKDLTTETTTIIVNEETQNKNVEPTVPVKKIPIKKKKIYTEKYLIAFSLKQKQTLESLSEKKTKKLSDLIKEAIKAHYSLSDDEF